MASQARVIDVAVQTVQELIAHMGLKATVSPRIESEGKQEIVLLWVRTDDAKWLIGVKGTHLRALEHVARTIVQSQFDERIPLLVLDINAYRSRQERRLQDLADQAREHVRSTGTPYTFPPMSARERRIVHARLSDRNDVRTESQGVGPGRRVVVHPESNANEEKIVSDTLVF